MGMKSQIAWFLICIVIAIAVIGCGEKTDETDSSERFRIPDSLLEAKSRYKLTRDDYHPIRGGVMANAQIVMHYPAEEIARIIAVKTFGVVYNSYQKVNETIGRPADGKLVLIGAKDLEEYKLLTRKEWWYYGVVAGDTIYFEPYDILFKRGIVTYAIMQKIAKAALIRRSGGKLPLWMTEAVASHTAGEGDILKMYGEGLKMQKKDVVIAPGEIETVLAEATDMDRTRAAFYTSYRMLENLLEFAALDDVLAFADELRGGASLDEASRTVFGMGYGELSDRVRVDEG